jgi:SprT-like family protein
MIPFRSAAEVQVAGEAPRLSMPAPELLARRLERLGVHRIIGARGLVAHHNRTVMLSYNGRGVLRLHAGFAQAPDRVLEAVIRFLMPRVSKAERLEAEKEFLAFPVFEHAEAPQRRRVSEHAQPGDVAVLHRLEEMHRRLNVEYFGGLLGPIRFRLSGRMRTRLGELTVDRKTGAPTEIALSRRHLRAHGWSEVEHTVLHEMVHQWQAETGLEVDHGPGFRKKAKSVGIVPSAVRDLGRRKAG